MESETSSEEHVPHPSALALTRFCGFLSDVLTAVKHENMKQKSVINKLTKIHSNLSEVFDQNQVSSFPTCSSSKEINTSLPELQESEKLLSRCKEIKKKFHHLDDNTNDCSTSKVQHHRKDTSTLMYKTICVRDSSKFGVIKETDLQQLTILLKPKNDYPGSQQNSREPTETSYLQLLEKNKVLKDKLLSCLLNLHTGCSLQFLQKIESSLCQGCIQHLVTVEEAEQTQSHNLTFGSHQTMDIFYSDIQDVADVCRLLCEIQFYLLNNSVRQFLEENVLPVIKDVHNDTRLQLTDLQEFLELDLDSF